MDAASPNSPSAPIETLLLLDHETATRLRNIWRLLCVGLVDMPVSLRLVSDSPVIQSLAFGPVQVVQHSALIWPWKHRRLDSLMSDLADRPAEVIHAGSSAVLPTALALAEEFDSDVILHITSVDDFEGLSAVKPPKEMRVLVGSTPLRQKLAMMHWIDDQRVSVIRPGLRADAHATCFQDPKRVPTLLCYEAMESGHGMELLVEALVRLQQRGLEVMAFLLGSGSREHQVHRTVVQRGLQNRVSFASPVGDPRALMHDADIFVVPSAERALTEISVLAMTSGVAVVAVEGGVADYYEHERTALLCGGGSSPALADALARLIEDRTLAQRLADGALSHMKSHHSMSSMVESTFQIYQAMAAAQRNIPLPSPPGGST